MTTTTTDHDTWAPPGPGGWQREVAHFPNGQTPLYRAVYRPAEEAGLRETNARYGLPADTLAIAHVGNRAYVRLRPLIEPPAGLAARKPPAAAVWLLSRVAPPLRRRRAAARRAFDRRLWREDGRRWYSETAPAFEAANRALQGEDVGAMGDGDLADHVDRALGHLAEGIFTHFSLVGANIVPLGDLLSTARAWGIAPTDALDLVRGTSPGSAEGARELEVVAGAVDVDDPPTSLEGLRALGPPAAQALDRWLERYGHRVVSGYDLDHPTFAELPGLVVHAVVAVARRRPAAEDDPVARLRGRVPVADRGRFDELVEEARYAYGLRDANAGLTLNWPAGLVRRAVLEAGRRLQGAGRVADPAHLFEATPDELAELLRGGGPAGEELGRRAARRRADLARPAPDHLGPEEPLPPVDVLPGPLRRVGSAALAVYELMNSDASRPAGHGTGIGTTPVRGRARVAADPATAVAVLQPGDVLVVPCTTPAYNAVLPIVSALVVEEGGALSHAALVCRELGITAVIGVTGATATIPDGAEVEVDPVAGTVQVTAPAA